LAAPPPYDAEEESSVQRYSLVIGFAAIGLCFAACIDAAQRVLIADFETSTAALKADNDKIAVESGSDAVIGENAARIGWRDATPGWSRGLRITLPETDAQFNALSLWWKADGRAYAAVELKVGHRAKGDHRPPLIVPPVWQRFVLPLEDFRAWGIKELLVQEDIGELSFRRIGWTGTFLVDQIEWIRTDDADESPPDSPCFSINAPKTIGDCDGLWVGMGDDPARPFDDVYQRLAQEYVFRYVRTRNIFTDGTAAWERNRPYGCRIYREDADGKDHYDFSLLDQMLDSFVELGFRPILEADFMRVDLAVGTPRLTKAANPADTELVADSAEGLPPTGKATIEPGDPIRYEGIRRTAEHCIQRYGREEVRQWYWEVWNESDLWWKHWHGAPDDPDEPDVQGLCRLYERLTAGLQEADPKLCAGGPGRKDLERSADLVKGIAGHDKLESMETLRHVPGCDGTAELRTLLPGCSASLWLLEPIDVEKPRAP
jgi:hypothetical protein